jgi:hypothetical protein
MECLQAEIRTNEERMETNQEMLKTRPEAKTEANNEKSDVLGTLAS